MRTKNVLAGSLLSLGILVSGSPLAAYAATTPTAVLTCAQTAVDARETAVQTAEMALHTAWSTALTTRATALHTAWSTADKATRRTQIKSAWAAYRASQKTTWKAWVKSRNSSWTTFKTAGKACKIDSKDETSSVKSDMIAEPMSQ